MKRISTLIPVLMALLALPLTAMAEETTSTFDFENNPQNWPVGEGANFADGNLTSPLTVGEVTLANVQGDATQPARIMRANDGVSALYVYKNGSVSLTAADGRALTKVEVTMKTGTFDLTVSNGSVSNDVWTGNATEVLFTSTATRQMLKLVVTTDDENAETVKPAQEETFDLEAASIADFLAAEDGKVVKLTLADARVNGTYNGYYVEDATGAVVVKGITLTVGTALNGYLIGTKSTDSDIDYMGFEPAPYEVQLTATDASTLEATATTLKGTVTSVAAAGQQANYGRLITVKNVSISGGGQNKTLTDAEGNTIKARDYMGVLPTGYTWPETAASITGVVIYYMTGWFIMPISADAIQETAASEPVVFDFTTASLRGYMGTSITDPLSYIINETYTIDDVSLQVTGGSAPSRITNINNRGNCLTMYKEYATLKFAAPQGKAITRIEYVFAGSGNLDFTPSSGTLEGLVWTGNAEAVSFLNNATPYLASATVTLADADGETATLEALPYVAVENIAAFNALEAGTPARLELNNAEVIGISADGYSTVFIQDATGGTMLQYVSVTDGLPAGVKLNGYVFAIKRVASGNSQLKEALDTPVGSIFDASELSELTTLEGTLSELNVEANKGRVVKLTGVRFEATKATSGTLTQGNVTIDVNNGTATANQQLHAVEFQQGDVIENATVVGILVGKSASENQILPLSITDGTTDGITTTYLSPLTSPRYNLQGQRLTQPARGINIVNGRKVVVK